MKGRKTGYRKGYQKCSLKEDIDELSRGACLEHQVYK